MSHFTVLVIGENAEDQLAPFDENLEVDEYITDEVTEREISRFMDFHRENALELKKHRPDMTPADVDVLGFEKMYEIFGDDWNGNRWRKDENGKWQEYSTYNPDSKWDWYVLGGRWTGFFKLKDGAQDQVGQPGVMCEPGEPGHVDAALKKDIDFDGMREEARIKAEKRYDDVRRIIDPFMPMYLTWKDMLAKHGLPHRGGHAEIADFDKKLDAALKEYHNQEAVKALHKNEVFAKVDDYVMSREEFVNERMDNACSTYAILKDGEWVAHGDMGWFGMSNDSMSESEWNKKFWEMIQALPDDTLLSVYDCHI